MHSNTCFEEDQLRQYAMGLLDDDSSDQVERHLASCETCDSAISTLDGSADSLVRSLRLKPEQSDAPSWIERLATHPEPESLAPVETTSQQAPTDPMVIGDYRLQRVLGRGGMSVVFGAKHLRLNSEVAFKVLKQPASAGRQAVERFCREMKSIGSLSHPAIVQAMDAGEQDGVHYLVMEKIDGVDLSRLLYQTGPLSIADACRIVCDLADALAHAHEAGIVHRDIKPSNVMLDRTGRVKLLDFGLARLTATTGEVTEATTVGQLLGTLDYMAPEQANGEHIDPRADVYSLGATLFRLLAGRPPHGRSSETPLLEFVRRMGSEEAPLVSDLRTDVPDNLARVLQRSLTRDADERIASATELREQLEPFAAGADLKSLLKDGPAAHIEESPSVDTELFELVQEMFPRRSIALASATSTPKPRRSNNAWWLAGVLTAILAPAIYFGVTILLKTPEGTVRIESDVDDVRLELVDEKDAVTKLQVNQTGKDTEVRAGRYRVRLAGESDGLQVSPREVVVKKGKTVVARIAQAKAATGEGKEMARIGPVVVEPVDDLGALLFKGNTPDIEKVSGMIDAASAKADRDSRKTEAVFGLSTMDSVSTAKTLLKMFANDDQPPSIKAALFGNSLVCRGSHKQIAQVTAALMKLGEPFGEIEGAQPAGSTGVKPEERTLKSYEFNGDVSTFVETLEAMCPGVFESLSGNRIYIRASERQHKEAQQLISRILANRAELQAKPGVTRLEPSGKSVPFLEVYKVPGSVTEVAKTIDALMPGRIVNEDVRSKSLHIKATAAEHAEIKTLLDKLKPPTTTMIGGVRDAVATKTLELKLELEMAKQKYAVTHPRVMSLKSQLEVVERVAAGIPDEPVYKGKPVRHWEAILKYETNKDAKATAATAIIELLPAAPAASKVSLLIHALAGMPNRNDRDLIQSQPNKQQRSAREVLGGLQVDQGLFNQLKDYLSQAEYREAVIVALASARDTVRKDEWQPIVDEAFAVRRQTGSMVQILQTTIQPPERAAEYARELTDQLRGTRLSDLFACCKKYEVPMSRGDYMKLAARALPYREPSDLNSLLPKGTADNWNKEDSGSVTVAFEYILDRAGKNSLSTREMRYLFTLVEENRVPASIRPKFVTVFEGYIDAARRMAKEVSLLDGWAVPMASRSVVLLTGRLPKNLALVEGPEKQLVETQIAELFKSRSRATNGLDLLRLYPLEAWRSTKYVDPVVALVGMLDENVPKRARFAYSTFIDRSLSNERTATDIVAVALGGRKRRQLILGTAIRDDLQSHATVRDLLFKWFESDHAKAGRAFFSLGATPELVAFLIKKAEKPRSVAECTTAAEVLNAWLHMGARGDGSEPTEFELRLLKDVEELAKSMNDLPFEYFEANGFSRDERFTKLTVPHAMKLLRNAKAYQEYCLREEKKEASEREKNGEMTAEALAGMLGGRGGGMASMGGGGLGGLGDGLASPDPQQEAKHRFATFFHNALVVLAEFSDRTPEIRELATSLKKQIDNGEITYLADTVPDNGARNASGKPDESQKTQAIKLLDKILADEPRR